jgi:hypothetical protein
MKNIHNFRSEGLICPLKRTVHNALLHVKGILIPALCPLVRFAQDHFKGHTSFWCRHSCSYLLQLLFEDLQLYLQAVSNFIFSFTVYRIII